MDYTHIIEELDKATLFDLYRLQVAINSELDSHKRIQKVKNSLQIGEEITWLDETTNRLEKAVVRKILKTRCEIRNSCDNKIWRILFASINLDNKEVDIKSMQKIGVKKSALRVGDFVSFKDNEHKIRFAKVVKLNSKTAGVVTMESENWRVSYDSLQMTRDIEAELYKQEVITKKNTLQENMLLDISYE